jgi:hypothetical protein
MVAKRKVTARVPKRTVKYRAKKAMPVRVGEKEVKKGAELTKQDAELVAASMGAKMSELFEEA